MGDGEQSVHPAATVAVLYERRDRKYESAVADAATANSTLDVERWAFDVFKFE